MRIIKTKNRNLLTSDNITKSTDFVQNSDIGVVSLERTAIKLSGNHKIVVCDDELFFEPITNDGSIPYMKINKNESYLHNLHRFFHGFLDKSMIWDTSLIDLAQNSSTFSAQYQNCTIRGVRTVEYDKVATNKEQKRFFAPLYTFGKIPDRFVILRLKKYESTAPKKFTDLINDADYVASYSLKESSTISKFIRSLINSQYFKEHSFTVNYETSEIVLNGIEVSSGKLIQKKVDISHILANELTVTEFNNVITNLYMNEGMVLPNIINLEFMFNDVLAPNGFNSYIGLYINEQEVSEHQAKFIKLNYEHESFVGLKKNAKDYSILKVEDKSSYTFNDSSINKMYDEHLYAKQFRRVEVDSVAICDIDIHVRPIVGTKFTIYKNDELIYELLFSSDIIHNKTTEEVVEYIAKDITRNLAEHVIHAQADRKLLRIINEDFSFDVSTITMSLPNSMKQRNNTKTLFVSLKHKTDIIVQNEQNEDYDSLYIDKIRYTPIDSFVYKGLNVIRLDKDIEKSSTNYASFSKTLEPNYYVLQLIDHVDFDRFRFDHHDDLLREKDNELLKFANAKNVLCVNWVAYNGNNTENKPIHFNNSLSFGINKNLSVSAIQPPLSTSIRITRNESIDNSILNSLISDTYDPTSLLINSLSGQQIYPSVGYATKVDDNHYYVLIDGVEYHIQDNLDGFKIYPIILNEPCNGVIEPITFVKNEVFMCAFLLISNYNYLYRNTNKVNVSFDIFTDSKYDDHSGSIRRWRSPKNKYTWYQSYLGKPVFRVGYTSGSIDIQSIKNNNRLDWFISESSKTEPIFKVSAEGIVEVTSDHLWCNDITIELYPNSLNLINGKNRIDGKSHPLTNEVILVDGVTYKIPLWKYFANGITKLSIKDSYYLVNRNAYRYKPVMPNVVSVYTSNGSINVASFIKKEYDKGLVKSFVSGIDLFQQNQLWHQIIELSKNAYYNEPDSNESQNFNFAKNVYRYLDRNKEVSTVIIDESKKIVNTTTNISITKHTSTPIITTIHYSDVLRKIVRRTEPMYANVIRYSGQYSPLFVKVLDAGILQTLPNVIFSDNRDYIESYANSPNLWLSKNESRHNQRFIFSRNNSYSAGSYLVSKRFLYRGEGDEVLVNDVPTIVSASIPINKRSINQLVLDENDNMLYTWSNDKTSLVQVIDVSDFLNYQKVFMSFDKSRVPEKLISQQECYLVSGVYENDSIQSYVLSNKEYSSIPLQNSIYKLWNGKNVIDIEPNVAFSEIPGFISTCFIYNGTFETKTICTGDTIDLVTLIKYHVGLSFNKKYQYITEPSVWSSLYEPLKYYYDHLTELNISLNDVYDLMFRRFYEEFFFYKYYVEEVRNESNLLIGFAYTNASTIKLQLPPNHNHSVLTIKFSKK